MIEKVKVGFYITKTNKDNLEKLKSFHLKINPTLDKLFTFDNNSIKEQIELSKKFQQKENIDISEENFFITTNPETIEKIRNPKEESGSKLMQTLENIASMTNNEKALEEDIKILMNKYLSSNLDTKVETQAQTEDESDEELLSKLQAYNQKEENSKKVSTTLKPS